MVRWVRDLQRKTNAVIFRSKNPCPDCEGKAWFLCWVDKENEIVAVSYPCQGDKPFIDQENATGSDAFDVSGSDAFDV